MQASQAIFVPSMIIVGLDQETKPLSGDKVWRACERGSAGVELGANLRLRREARWCGSSEARRGETAVGRREIPKS